MQLAWAFAKILPSALGPGVGASGCIVFCIRFCFLLLQKRGINILLALTLNLDQDR